jgi:hypothetical protein
MMNRISNKPKFRDELKARVGASDGTTDQELFTQVLQAQFDKTMAPLWLECNDYNPSEQKVCSPPVIKKTHDHVKRLIRVGEHYAGQASFSKSARDSGGAEVVYVSERNVALHPHLVGEFPLAEVFNDNQSATAEYITRQGIEGVMGGPPCQDLSVGNQKRRGNGGGSRSGTEYQNAGSAAAKAYGGAGTAWQLWECAPGVHKSYKGGGSSPYQQLLDNNSGFHDALGGAVLRADRVASPLTGQAAPVHHSRAYVALVNELDFPRDAKGPWHTG